MSKKLGLENKYRQFINPRKLKEYSSVMGKIEAESKRLKAMKSIPKSFFKNVGVFPKVAKGVLKKTLPGKLVTSSIKPLSTLKDLGSSEFFKRAMTLRSGNKKMGGGMMMKYKTGKDVKLSPKQKKIAAMAGDPNKIDAPDFDKLRSMKKKNV